MGWGDWDYSLSSPRSSMRITREGRAHGRSRAGWLDNTAGTFALRRERERRRGKKLPTPAAAGRDDQKSQGKE